MWIFIRSVVHSNNNNLVGWFMIGMSPAISEWWLYWNALCIWYNQQGGEHGLRERVIDPSGWFKAFHHHQLFSLEINYGTNVVRSTASSSKYNNVAIIPAGPCHLFIWHRFRCLSNSSWFIIFSFFFLFLVFPFYCHGHFSWPDIHIHVLLSPQKNINVGIGYIRV